MCILAGRPTSMETPMVIAIEAPFRAYDHGEVMWKSSQARHPSPAFATAPLEAGEKKEGVCSGRGTGCESATMGVGNFRNMNSTKLSSPATVLEF